MQYYFDPRCLTIRQIPSTDRPLLEHMGYTLQRSQEVCVIMQASNPDEVYVLGKALKKGLHLFTIYRDGLAVFDGLFSF